jgi:broad specificity phosphatase PhoE
VQGANSGYQGAVRLLSAPFYFVRHGESEANVASVIAGAIEPPLTPNGRAQAERAANLLMGRGIAAIIASPQGRAADTAHAIAVRLGLPVAFDPGLVERRWGVWEGRPIGERPHYFIDPEQGESWPVFVERTRLTVEAIRLPSPTVVVAHSGTHRALRELVGLDPSGESVANGLPILFAPAAPGSPWRAEPIANAVSSLD